MVPKNSISISDGNGDFAAAVKAAFIAANVDSGLAVADGQPDKNKVRARILEVLLEAGKVLNPGERKAKAVTRGALAAAVYPSLVSEDFEDEDNPALARAVWDKAREYIWNTATTNALEKFQQLVGMTMGNGYVMCRTQISTADSMVWAAYITDNRACIEQDFIGPEVEALQRRTAQMVANREMLVYRQPKNADRWVKQFDAVLKAIATSVHDQLTMAATAAKANEVNGADEADEPNADEPNGESEE
jgi:hypothetical protein